LAWGGDKYGTNPTKQWGTVLTLLRTKEYLLIMSSAMFSTWFMLGVHGKRESVEVDGHLKANMLIPIVTATLFRMNLLGLGRPGIVVFPRSR
jgi:putative heme iron utilization protein